MNKQRIPPLYLKVVLIVWCCNLLNHPQMAVAQPCFPEQPKTAAYATGGSSPYRDQVLWLTWGSALADLTEHPYGKKDQLLGNGSRSHASIDIGGGRYLCVRAEISNINGGQIYSYAPGDYVGDSMDDLYNIGGNDKANILVNGIRNNTTSDPAVGQEVSFTITCKAWVNGTVPVRLAGLVLGDAESLNSGGEFFHVTADGAWNIVELKKNIPEDTDEYPGEYLVRKTSIDDRQRIHFAKGNDNNTAAVSFLTFNPTAYGSADDDYEVSFDVRLKGTGITALALGLLTISADGGDAPESYGTPLHLFEGLTFTSDGIPVVAQDGPTTNLNTTAYTPGALVSDPSTYLGSTGPDADSGPLYSDDALGDDNDPNASAEEDAWPIVYKRFSYKTTYMPGDIIRADIPYRGATDGYITGWIDFNRNGIFDNDERQQAFAPASTNGVVTLEWKVPADRVPRNTFVRLRYSPTAAEVLLPDGIATGGEVEDHRIYVLFPVPTNPMLPSKGKRNWK